MAFIRTELNSADKKEIVFEASLKRKRYLQRVFRVNPHSRSSFISRATTSLILTYYTIVVKFH